MLKAAFLTLDATAVGATTSNLIFSHESGARTAIEWDGSTLRVPDTCTETDCSQLRTARDLHSAKFVSLGSALIAENDARLAADATLRAAVVDGESARKAADASLRALVLTADATLRDMIESEDAARAAADAQLKAETA